MNYAALALCLALIAFGTVNLLGSLVVAAALPWAGRGGAPRLRARRILLFRLFPTAAAVLFLAGLFLPAFFWLEPRATKEITTPAMLGLAAAAAAILVAGPLRGARSILATERLVRRWRRDARPVVLPGLSLPARVIEEALPVVTVVGVIRPRLYIARLVLEGCSPSELAAIVSHETAHVEHRDNLKRLVLRSLPDWIGLTPWAAWVEQMWSEATEDAADDRAAGHASAPDLAAALLKVARLAAPADSCIAPASALYRGGGLARRVERLLRPGAPRATTPLPLLPVGSFGVVLGLALGVRYGLLERVHGITEIVVRLLQ